MDEFHCRAYPHTSDFAIECSSFLNSQQHFCVEFEYVNMYVLNANKFDTFCKVTLHTFPSISKHEIMQEATIVSWLSMIGVPSNAHSVVVAKISQCARDMVTDTTLRQTHVLCMHVEVIVTRANEDGIGDSDIDNDDTFEDNPDDFEEEEEEEEEDYGFVPAEKTSVEGLEKVEQKGSQRCAICFEDFLVGVRMPCLHVFHKSCISEWLQVGNSCPLCRFQMPPKSY